MIDERQFSIPIDLNLLFSRRAANKQGKKTRKKGQDRKTKKEKKEGIIKQNKRRDRESEMG